MFPLAYNPDPLYLFFFLTYNLNGKCFIFFTYYIIYIIQGVQNTKKYGTKTHDVFFMAHIFLTLFIPPYKHSSFIKHQKCV